MVNGDWTKNTIKVVPHNTGVYTCFGNVHESDMIAGSDDIPSALALLAVRMAKANWECDPGKIPTRQAGKFLEEGFVVIEFKGGENGWVVEYWPDGKQDDSVGACHVLRPEVAVATVALMVANPQLYNEPTDGE